MPVKLRLFGVPQYLDTTLDSGETQWTSLPLDNRGALLMYLAHAGSRINREQAAFLFWPDTDDASAKRNLRQLISRIKELPLAAKLESNRKSLGWIEETDVAAFLQAKENQDWQTALEIASAPFCDGLNDVGVGMLSWLELERSSLNNMVNSIRHTYSQDLIAKGNYSKATKIIEPLVKENLASEDVMQDYLRCLYLAGKRDIALKAYTEFATQLRAEFALEPLPETKQLLATIEASQQLNLNSKNTVKNKHDIPLTLLHPPKLVGREEALQTAKSKIGNILVVKGEAGIGKTRFINSSYPESYYLRCEEGLQHIPYHPIVGFIRSQLSQGKALPDLSYYQADLARLIPELATDVQHIADPMAEQIRLLEAITQYIEGISTSGTALFLDDLQWADDKTLELIIFITKRKEQNTDLILSYRSNEVSQDLLKLLSTLDSRQDITTIELAALTEKQLLTFLQEDVGLGPASVLNEFTNWMHSATSGNLMFVLELLKSLYESGSICSTAGKIEKAKQKVGVEQLELIDSLDQIKLTTNFNNLIGERISSLINHRQEKLLPEAKRLLQSMSVASELNLQQLGQVTGLSDWGLIDAIDELEKTGFVSNQHFKHDILREVTYQSLSPTHKQLIHKRVATLIVENMDPAITAEHWYAAGDSDKAMNYWNIAAQQRIDAGLHHNAISILERATKLESTDYTIHLLLLANYYVQIGYYQPATEIAEKLLNSKTIDLQSNAEINGVLGMAKIYEGQLQEAESYLAEALRISASQSENQLSCNSLFLMRMQHALAKTLLGDSSYAEQVWVELTNTTDTSISKYLVLQNYFLLAGLYARSNRIEEARAIHDTQLSLPKNINAPHYQMMNMYFYINYHYHHGDTSSAEVTNLLEEAKEMLTTGFSMGTPFLLEGLIDTYIARGDFETAEVYANTLLEDNYPVIMCAIWARKAKLCILTNRPKEAHEAFELTLETIQTTGYADAIAVAATIILNYGDVNMQKEIQAKIEYVQHAPILFHYRTALDKALLNYDKLKTIPSAS